MLTPFSLALCSLSKSRLVLRTLCLTRVCLGLGRLVEVRPHNISCCQSKKKKKKKKRPTGFRMASSGFATPSLNWSSPNLPEAFRSFRQHSTLIFDGPFANKMEKEKVTYLLLWIGSHGRDIYDGWTWNTPEEKFRLQIVLERFQRHIEPQVNSYPARYTFHQCRQATDESVDEFIARCRVIAAKCKFTDLMETNIFCRRSS